MNNKTISIKFPVLSILGVAFVILKLTGVIAWSWWWVTLPFWIIPALGLLIFAITFVAMFLLSYMED